MKEREREAPPKDFKVHEGGLLSPERLFRPNREGRKGGVTHSVLKSFSVFVK